MTPYRVVIKRSATKEIERLPIQTRARVVDAIGALAIEPQPRGCEKLSAQERYRIRVGDHRVVYSVADETVTVVVVKVGHRRDVYRG